jgi:hypothetical protein
MKSIFVFLAALLSPSVFASGEWVNGKWVDPTCLPPACMAAPPLFLGEVFLAAPMQTLEQARDVAQRRDEVVETGTDDAPFVLIMSEVILVHPTVESDIGDLVARYLRSRTWFRSFLVERYPDRTSAQRRAEFYAATGYGFLHQTWIAESRDGSAFLVYRNPDLQH